VPDTTAHEIANPVAEVASLPAVAEEAPDAPRPATAPPPPPPSGPPPLPPRSGLWRRPGQSIGIELLSVFALRFDTTLETGGQIGLRAGVGVSYTVDRTTPLVLEVLYDLPSASSWQLELGGGLMAWSAHGHTTYAAPLVTLAAQYDPPSPFFLTLGAYGALPGGNIYAGPEITIGWTWPLVPGPRR
jgi:hypothetical protein